MKKQRVWYFILASLMALSLAACKGQADEQASARPTPSTQPTAAPTPTPPPIPYTDVAVDAPYYDAVVWAYKNGVASGGDAFEPLSDCTRGQAITFLWRAMGSPEPEAAENPFSDVPPDAWYYQPALWAYENGVAAGTAFNPGSPCTNGEALTFLWRAEGKPAASVYNSTVALAASGQYYARPAAWADNNGLFAQMGTAFDPSAPCSRAYLMSCLYWAEEQRASSEDRALQAEYGKIIGGAMCYEVHGSGLIYADYVDVEGDGKVELLTVGLDKDLLITAAVYKNTDGHAEKYCEGTFKTAYFGKFGTFSVGTADDGQLYVCSAGGTVERAGAYHDGTSQLFKAGKGAFSLENDLHYKEEYNFEKEVTEYTYFVSGNEVAKDEYDKILKKYPDSSTIPICSIDFGNPVILDRGLLSAPKIEVNGSAVKLSAEPYLDRYDNVFMAPLRDMLEAMGVAVYANSDASAILASTKKDTLVITYKDFSDGSFKGINSDYYGRDKTYRYSMNGGKFQELDVVFTDGKAFVPFQTLVSLFGAKAEWNGEVGAVQIAFDLPDSSCMSQDELKKAANFDVEQAQRIAVEKGYKGPWDGAPIPSSQTIEFYGMDDAKVLAFKNGKAVWTLYTGNETEYIRDETGRLVGESIEMYRIDVASDGTVTEYPNDKAHTGAGQM